MYPSICYVFTFLVSTIDWLGVSYVATTRRRFQKNYNDYLWQRRRRPRCYEYQEQGIQGLDRGPGTVLPLHGPLPTITCSHCNFLGMGTKSLWGPAVMVLPVSNFLKWLCIRPISGWAPAEFTTKATVLASSCLRTVQQMETKHYRRFGHSLRACISAF